MVIGENMLEAFVDQNYLIIESNVVTNITIWNGDTSQWTPPQGSIALVQATIPAMVWQPIFVNEQITDWVLNEQIGAGAIGFTWDGTVLTTNQPKPAIPQQPESSGLQQA
jgi:hypothetical protein